MITVNLQSVSTALMTTMLKVESLETKVKLSKSKTEIKATLQILIIVYEFVLGIARKKNGALSGKLLKS